MSNQPTFDQEALNPAVDVAAAIAMLHGGRVTTNHDYHDMTCVETAQPWPTVVFDWGHVDFLPVLDTEWLLSGFEVHVFCADTAAMYGDSTITLFDMERVATNRLMGLAVRLMGMAL